MIIMRHTPHGSMDGPHKPYPSYYHCMSPWDIEQVNFLRDGSMATAKPLALETKTRTIRCSHLFRSLYDRFPALLRILNEMLDDTTLHGINRAIDGKNYIFYKLPDYYDDRTLIKCEIHDIHQQSALFFKIKDIGSLHDPAHCANEFDAQHILTQLGYNTIPVYYSYADLIKGRNIICYQYKPQLLTAYEAYGQTPFISEAIYQQIIDQTLAIQRHTRSHGYKIMDLYKYRSNGNEYIENIAVEYDPKTKTLECYIFDPEMKRTSSD